MSYKSGRYGGSARDKAAHKLKAPTRLFTSFPQLSHVIVFVTFLGTPGTVCTFWLVQLGFLS